MAPKMNVSLLFLIFLINLVSTRDVDFCFADESDPYLYMATKTAYHFVNAGKTRFQSVPSKWPTKRNLKNQLQHLISICFADCHAEQVWMLITHGTRCPLREEDAKMLELTEIQSQIINNHESRGSKYISSFEFLKSWEDNSNKSTK